MISWPVEWEGRTVATERGFQAMTGVGVEPTTYGLVGDLKAALSGYLLTTP